VVSTACTETAPKIGSAYAASVLFPCAVCLALCQPRRRAAIEARATRASLRETDSVQSNDGQLRASEGNSFRMS